MGVSLKLTDNLYWDSSNIDILYQDGYYRYDQISCEVRAGTVAMPNWASGGAYGVRKWIDFDHAVSSAPIVITSNASDYDSYWQCGVNYFTGGIPTTSGFYAKAFRVWNDSDMVFPNQAISYMAVVPKRTGYAPSGGSMTYNEQRTQGRNPLPSKISSGTGVALTDDHWWDLSAIRDAQDTSNYTLDKTFYRIVSGVTSLTIPNNTNGSGKVVDIGYTFKDAPHIIATIGKGTTDTTVANTNGLVKISAFAKSPNTGTGSVYSGSSFATKTWDMHKQFAIRGFNHSGASVTINVNWIAIGLTQ